MKSPRYIRPSKKSLRSNPIVIEKYQDTIPGSGGPLTAAEEMQLREIAEQFIEDYNREYFEPDDTNLLH